MFCSFMDGFDHPLLKEEQLSAKSYQNSPSVSNLMIFKSIFNG